MKNAINTRNVAFKNKYSLKETEKELRTKMRNARLTHRQHLEDAFKANNRKRVWDIMKSTNGMASTAKPIVTENEPSFASS